VNPLTPNFITNHSYRTVLPMTCTDRQHACTYEYTHTHTHTHTHTQKKPQYAFIFILESLNGCFSCHWGITLAFQTNSNKWNPSWQANMSSPGTWEISQIVWNLKVHQYVQNSLPLYPVLSLTNLAHTLTPYFIKIHLNASPPIYAHSWFPIKILNAFLTYPTYHSCHTQLFILN